MLQIKKFLFEGDYSVVGQWVERKYTVFFLNTENNHTSRCIGEGGIRIPKGARETAFGRLELDCMIFAALE